MSQDLAAQVNEARLATLGMLMAGLAHEINTPLGALNSNHDVLRRALRKLQDILADEIVEPHELDEVRRVVRAIDGILSVNDIAVERMTGLVRNLRNFGRLDQAEIDFVDLHDGLDGTLAILAHELKGVTVVREFGDLPAVECHPQQVNQVFMNLLLNARQATAEGGTITVRTRSAEEYVEVTVADTGSGIVAEHLDRIFEPGFTSKGSRVGMGLGLPICLQIVEQHGGRIVVQSEPGAGAVFTVRLPRRHQGPAAGEAANISGEVRDDQGTAAPE
ncbi:MAG TPA: ATP-binding protein [Longimicrobiales bacterium]|nr:ATP-binding protein [Longimicrobiales bacterium]